MLRREDFEQSFGERPVDAFLCQHVWEHLSEEQGRGAAALCGGVVRRHCAAALCGGIVLRIPQAGRLGFSHLPLEIYHAKFVALDGGGYTDKSALFAELVRQFELPIEAEALLLDFRQRLSRHCQLFPMHFPRCKPCVGVGFVWAL